MNHVASGPALDLTILAAYLPAWRPKYRQNSKDRLDPFLGEFLFGNEWLNAVRPPKRRPGTCDCEPTFFDFVVPILKRYLRHRR